MDGNHEQYKYDNYYELLGVDKDSSIEEIKKKYRVLAKRHHPDLGGNTEMFERVTEAYETLIDPTTRKNYEIAHNFYRANNFDNDSIEHYKSSFHDFMQQNNYNLTEEERNKIKAEKFNVIEEVKITEDEMKEICNNYKTSIEDLNESTKNKNKEINNFLVENDISINDYFDYIYSTKNNTTLTNYTPYYDFNNQSSMDMNMFSLDTQDNTHMDINITDLNVQDIKNARTQRIDTKLTNEEIEQRIKEYNQSTLEINENIKKSLTDKTSLDEIKNFLGITYEIKNDLI